MGKVNYVVIGSGLQGTAVGYDLVRFGKAGRVVMVDRNAGTATEAAHRINHLTNRLTAAALVFDARETSELKELLKETDVCIGAASYTLNEQLTRTAIEAGCHFCDMGGNTDVVRAQHAMDGEARKAGICVLPDCGLAPGMANILAGGLVRQFDQCDEIRVYCGGLPQQPKPPLGYMLVFSIEGLTNEYTGEAEILRDGVVIRVPTLDGLEEIEFDAPVGRCEAFYTSGGTSTAPHNFRRTVKNYEYKTVRYPGHHTRIKLLLDLGLLDLEPVMAGKTPVIPRALLHALMAPRISFPEDRDLVVLRVLGSGRKDGKNLKLRYDLYDTHDETTGFSAMARTTGFPTAVCAILMTRGNLLPGVHPVEEAVDCDAFVTGMRRRGISLIRTVQPQED